jgi:ribosome-binding factor A
MSRRRRPSTRDLLASTDVVGPEDGDDPVRFHDRRRWDESPAKPGRKALQLCGQVKDALHGILSRMADPAVRDVTVLSVEPAPHAARLKVTVAVHAPADVTDRVAAAGNLDRATTLIRREVAAAICRRKVPELVFRVV